MTGTRPAARDAAAALLRAAGGLVPALRALLSGVDGGTVEPRASAETPRAERPPSPKQVAFLKRFGHGEPRAVRTSREADSEIKRLVAEQGGRR